MNVCAMAHDHRTPNFGGLKEMSKKPNKKSSARSKYDGPMTGGMKFFLTGCVAELYLLVVRRFYIDGTISQVLAWNTYLKVFAVAGVIAAAAGVFIALSKKLKTAQKAVGPYLFGLGLFVAVSSALVLVDMSALSILTTIVPVVLVLDILWWLFDRDSALSLTALAGALVVVWMCRRGAVGTSALLVKALGAAYVAAVAVIALLLKNGKLSKLISLDGHKMVYAACAISAVGVAAGLVSATIAYYVMWGLSAVLFCMAVYYTVRQL